MAKKSKSKKAPAKKAARKARPSAKRAKRPARKAAPRKAASRKAAKRKAPKAAARKMRKAAPRAKRPAAPRARAAWPNEGEGSSSADKAYRDAATRFTVTHDTEALAEQAAREVDASPHEYDDAENEGLSHSAGDLPQDEN